MKILTLDNQCFALNNLPDQLEEDVRFSVLDNSNPKDPDFFFVPLIFLESFSSPAMVLEIGGQQVTMPLEWSIVVGDGESGLDLEVLPLTSLNDRGFQAFIYNPLTSFSPEFSEIKIVNFYNDMKWYFPKMKNGQMLTVPIIDTYEPPCAFFVKDVTRQSELIDYTLLV